MTALDATNRLVGFVDEFSRRTIPEAIRRECTRAFVNAMGCMIAGGGHELVENANRGVMPFSGSPSASLFGRGEKTDALSAALLNGLSGAAYSFDDAYSEALLHPTGPAAAALLSVAETRPMSGADFIAYLALGMEVSCRLANVIASSKDKSWIAWSQTGICCGAGVALAVGKALGLGREQLDWALGIALSQAAGTRATHGSMAASLIFGQAASTGLRAAMLAQAGFTCSSASIESKYGFASVFAKDTDVSLLTSEIGREWMLKSNTYKPFPCAVMIHASLDGVLQLKKEAGFPYEDVEAITLTIPPAAITLCSRPQPANEMEAKLSIEHWIAAGAVFGKARISEGTRDVVSNPDVARIRKAVVLVSDAELDNDAAVVTIALRDGKRLQRSVAHCVGGLAMPMSDNQLTEKFLDLSTEVIGHDRAREVLDLCWSANDLSDIGIAAKAAC